MKRFKTLYKKTAKGATQVWEIRAEEGPNGVGVLITSYGHLGGKMQEMREEITQGKNIGKKNETTPYAQACAEAESRWNKQKDRKGYGLTVEESAAVRGVSAMLAQVYNKHAKKVDWGNAFAQPKLDGFRCLMTISTDGKVTMVSRENQPFNALSDMQHVVGGIARTPSAKRLLQRVPAELVLDGELYCHGMSLNEISSACKRKSTKTAQLSYHVYDAMLSGADFSTRYAIASEFVKLDTSDLLVPVDTVKVRSESDLMHCQGNFISEGYEGAMLRYGGLGYESGKRSATLLKVKTFEDAEFCVTDFKNGRGKYADCAIFVCETSEGNTFEVTAPGTIEEKQRFLREARTYVGKKLTVKFAYMTKTEESVPFQPVAIRFRDE